MLNILLLLIGFVVLVVGADKLVDGASALARKYNIPNIVIGLTIVALGTSAPEMVVNVFAAATGNTEIVMGNILGSNIFNILGIIGISALIFPLRVTRNTTWIDVPLSLMAAVVVLVSASDIFLDGAASNIISRSDGIILLFLFAIFLSYNFHVALNHNEEGIEDPKPYTIGKSVFFIMAGLAGLIIGGRLIVVNAVNIATAMGISERIISLTIVSIGTSLPELATSIVAVRKRNVDIAIGNAVGSNIFNIFLILGISTIITPVPIAASTFADMGVNILASLLLFIFIFTGRGRSVQRVEGAILMALYIAYLIFLIQG